jgi:hypothetical protein
MGRWIEWAAVFALLAGYGWLLCWSFQHDPGAVPGYAAVFLGELLLLALRFDQGEDGRPEEGGPDSEPE